jgi:hypothetical protein
MAPLGALNWDDAAPVEGWGEAEALVDELSEEVEEEELVAEPAMKKGVLV